MSDTAASGGQNPQAAGPNGQGQQGSAAPIVVHAQYIKDFSFEAPHVPEIYSTLAQGAQPDIPVSVDVQGRTLNDSSYEVQLLVNIEARVGDQTAFLLEIAYGAVVSINVPQEHTELALLVEVPRLLFPFVRQIVATAINEGGFPPLLLQPVDFMALYRQRQMQQANQQGTDQTAAPADGA